MTDAESACFVCDAGGVSSQAISIPERPGMNVCQLHYESLGIADAIREADEVDAANPENALFRQINFIGAMVDSILDSSGSEHFKAVETAALPENARDVIMLLALKVRAGRDARY